MVASIYNASTWEVGAGGSIVQGNPKLHSKLEASLGLMKLYHIYIYITSNIYVYYVMLGKGAESLREVRHADLQPEGQLEIQIENLSQQTQTTK